MFCNICAAQVAEDRNSSFKPIGISVIVIIIKGGLAHICLGIIISSSFWHWLFDAVENRLEITLLLSELRGPH